MAEIIEEGINIAEKESFFKKNNNIEVQREDKKLKRVDFLGHRCYQTPEGKYYPSVTTILNSLPSDPFFLQWLAETGVKNSEIIRDRAAREGTQLHEGIEHLLNGGKLDWVDEYGNARYNLTVWKMLLKFQDFYNLVKPETIETEMFLWSDEYEYAGTTDYLCKVGDETWLLDWKSSNHCHMLSYGAQLAAYANALKERKGIKVDRCGVVWFKASTRSTKIDLKRNIVQGQGWQILFVEDMRQAFDVFLLANQMYHVISPGPVQPLTASYPTEISLS